MKLASLLAGVAVVALSATAASAQSVNTFSNGQITPAVNVNLNLPGTYGNLSITGAGNTANVPVNNILPGLQNIANTLNAENSGATSASWHVNGFSVSNSGAANGNPSDGATFSLEGSVTEDCAFYTGSSNSLSFDFGTLGIYASDNTGPAAAFTMVAPAALNFDTNLAGCNTANSVTITKTGGSAGLVNNAAGGYDTNVFQANLQYNITARYTAGDSVTPGVGSAQTLLVSDTAPSNTRNHGAWKSAMDIQVVVPQAPKALVAGDYTGNFVIEIKTI